MFFYKINIFVFYVICGFLCDTLYLVCFTCVLIYLICVLCEMLYVILGLYYLISGLCFIRNVVMLGLYWYVLFIHTHLRIYL